MKILHSNCGNFTPTPIQCIKKVSVSPRPCTKISHWKLPICGLLDFSSMMLGQSYFLILPTSVRLFRRKYHVCVFYLFSLKKQPKMQNPKNAKVKKLPKFIPYDVNNHFWWQRTAENAQKQPDLVGLSENRWEKKWKNAFFSKSPNVPILKI